MNYELAKELKDAGFPQPNWLDENVGYFLSDPTPKSLERAYVPTLEELIEAVQMRPTLPFHLMAGDYQNGGWKAQTNQSNACVGSTPTEAVARLWLALHTPSK